ncbi:MAG: enoyl-CoA hydratase [Acidobacteriota bacterium]
MALIETHRSGGVVTVTLNRPEKLNAVAGSMRQDLLDVLDNVSRDSSCHVAILTGAGRAFCAGGDIGTMAALQADGDRAGFNQLLEAGAHIVSALRSLPQMVIASINGVAAGAGCNLALACDYRIASETASLGQTFIRIGLHPDWGGSWFLPRLVGSSRAMELMMTGRMVDANEALSLGMVDRVVPFEQLSAETSSLAEKIAAAPPLVVRAIKRSTEASADHTLGQQLALEMDEQLRAFTSADAGEGMKAFLEKRNPQFRGE